MKPIITILLSALYAISLSASPVDIATVKKITKSWVSQKTGTPIEKVEIDDIIEEKINKVTVIYICILEPSGFLIVSANDIANPIIAYSETDNFSKKNMPKGFEALLEISKKDIYYAITEKASPLISIQKKWDELLSNNVRITKGVDPLIITTWGQGFGYNTLCPIDSSLASCHVPAGCIATTMAQVLRYYSYPVTGSGDTSYMHSEYGLQSANFGATTYHYERMPLSLNGTINYDLATLVYHCGVSVCMDYAPDGSSASSIDVVNALKNFFSYSDDIHISWRRNFQTEEWINTLKNEINNNRIVYYRGSDTTGSEIHGHAFIIDGYTDQSLFHINWGWNGAYQDVFYSLDNLTPGSNNFNAAQAAILNIYPLDTNYGINQTPEKATNINLPYEEEHIINPLYDIDWYRTYLPSGIIYNMHTELPATSQLDTKAWLFGPCSEEGYELLEGLSQYLIAEDDDSHGNYQPELRTEINESGFYYLRIAHYANGVLKKKNKSSTTGEYNLIINTTQMESPDLYIHHEDVPDYIPYQGGNFSIDICNGGAGTLLWAVEEIPEWITVNPQQGSTTTMQHVSIHVEQNSSTSGRSYTLVFYNTQNPLDKSLLSVKQLGPGTYIFDEDISGVWDINGSPYIICNDVDVKSDDELLIKEGVVVKFQENYDMFVYGKLQVEGSPDAHVIFCSDQEGNPWDEITIYSPESHDECFIKYADFIQGGLEIRGNSLIKGCNFIGCTAMNSSVVDVEPDCGGNARFINCSFLNNSYKRTLEIDYSDIQNRAQFIGCNFIENTNNENSDSPIMIHGDSFPYFQNCNFLQNSVFSDSGDGGAIGMDDETGANFEFCSFVQNSSNDEGGAVYIDLSSGSVPSEQTYFSRCNFDNNYAGERGGAVHMENEISVIFESCRFLQNSSGEKGGALSTVHLQGDQFFINCIFDNNESDNGNCAHIHSWGGMLIFINSIIKEPSSVFSNDDNYVECYYSIIPHGDIEYMYEGCSTEDPNLDATYFPNPGSICINSGTTLESFLPSGFEFSHYDFGGNPRIMENLIDIGIYETLYSETEKPLTNSNNNSLYQNTPNPFHNITKIFVNLTSQGHLAIEIYDTRGRNIKTLVNRDVPKGINSFYWDGTNNQNKPCEKGIYLYKMNINGKSIACRKCILL